MNFHLKTDEKSFQFHIIYVGVGKFFCAYRKGAGIGAAAGAAGGTAIAGAKKGQQLQIPSETLLEFRVQQPVSLPVAG